MRELEHGEVRAYRAGCRCTPCRAAHACLRARYRRSPAGGLVSAFDTQEHLLMLANRGVGYRRVAELAGVGYKLVKRIRRGHVLRIRASTARRLLAVTPSLAKGARVQSWPIRRTVRAIEKEGYTREEIAQRLGLRTKRPAFDTESVTVATALKVLALYRQVQEEGPGPEEPAA